MRPDDIVECRSGGKTRARCALWWKRTPRLNGRKVGYIGRYERSDPRAAQEVLQAARARLAVAGCDTAVGPVDGSTWHRYRFVTERGLQPPFFLEPSNPDDYPRDFTACGFRTLARYVSAEETRLDDSDERVVRAADRLANAGVRVRPIDLGKYAAELDRIYDVACESFADALLFSPISRQEFHALHEPLQAYLDPDFIRVAEHNGRAVGFAFGIPDVTALQRGEPVDTIVGKTQAVLPALRYAGLGAVMLDSVRQSARARGMRRIIHALIRDDNSALKGSSRVAETMRSYTLFENPLI
jgi:GNAT superfamily N-acetyltransferase